jgi:peptidoglycan/LPS O-acetylase OafA/YrhL
LVLAEHTANAISTRYLGLSPKDSPLAVFPFPAGVDIFFVISGFIIAYSSGSLFGRTGAWREFLLRRLARIVPLYWLITGFMIYAFSVIGSRAWSDASWASVAASFLFVPATNADGLTFPILTIGWTLNYEMAFYLLFAAALCFPQATALTIVVGALVLLVALGELFEPTNPVLRFWTSPVILEFAAGICLYEFHRSGRLALSGIARLLLSVAALLCLALYRGEPGFWRWIIWGGPATVLVAAALGPTSFQGIFAKAARRAGDWSYGIYLAHFPIVMIGAMACQVLLPRTNWVWLGFFPLLILTATLAAAALLHRFVERPFMVLARRAVSDDRFRQAIPAAPSQEQSAAPLDLGAAESKSTLKPVG